MCLFDSIASYGVHTPPPDEGKCELIGTFSLITQALLGLLCLSSLLVKRYYEYPVERSWQVWLFDVLKQITGAFGVHVFNVLLSILKGKSMKSLFFIHEISPLKIFADSQEPADPCDWYFLSIMLDCTIGVYILYLVFRHVTFVCKQYLGITQIDSGDYGPDQHKPSVRAFLKQLTIYFLSLMITKILLYILVECFETQLLWFTSTIILRWLDEYPDEFEIFLIMFVVPVFMNCLQLILIDNFIQNQTIWQLNKQAALQVTPTPSSTSATPLFKADTEIEQANLNSQQPRDYGSINV